MSSHSFSDATPLERSVFLLFMLLWVIYGLINQHNSLAGITFDPTTVVWSQEVLKIILSLALYFIQDGGPSHLCREIKEHWTMVFWYMIPAGLYALGDVLTYINLRSFDPATLHLLGEMKLVVTAIVHQFLFQRRLNPWHWTALAIITAGCIVKAVDSMKQESGEDKGSQDTKTSHHDPTLFNYGLIALYIFLTTVAGVFNEKLLKDKPSIGINLQNMCLYLDGILFLSLGIWAGISEGHKSITEALSLSNLKALFSQPSILAMAIVMSLAGIVTSRFLKVFDSIRKSVAVALVVVSLPLLSRLFFGTPITAKMILSIVMVVAGMHIYTSQPPPKAVHPDENNEVDKNNNEEEGEAELFLPDNHRNDEHHRSAIQEMPKLPPSALSNSVLLTHWKMC